MIDRIILLCYYARRDAAECFVGGLGQLGVFAMNEQKTTRRKFMRDAAAGAAGIALGLSPAGQAFGTKSARSDETKIRNYNPRMEYRRLGKTNLMVSAVSLGGHWTRAEVMKQDCGQNRRDVVSRAIDVGVNYIDACCREEVLLYCKALRGRRDKVYLALSYASQEVRNDGFRTTGKLIASLDSLLKESKQEYTDLWRITCNERGGSHSFDTACQIVGALEKAKKQGKARFVGISSHDRRWLEFMVEYFSQIEVVLFPYTARTKVVAKGGLFETVQKRDVGAFGIKPFAAGSVFSGSSAPDDPHAEEDDQRARLVIRRILSNPHVIPIPGLISTHQVDNVAKAVTERRQLDSGEATHLDRLMDQAWATLPAPYQWLKDWQYV